MKRSVYLAGPITATTHGTSTSWRQLAFDRFSASDIEAFSPMRFGSSVTGDQVYSDAYSDPTSIFSSTHGILERDLADIRRVDLCLFNFLDAKEVSRGSVVEIGYAKAKDKLLVIAIEDAKEILSVNLSRVRRNMHDHAFITGLTPYIVDNLDDAISASIRLLTASGH